MAGRVQDKVIIVTGASSGIGEAAAILLAEEGAKVVLAARRDKTQKVVDGIKAKGGEAIYVETDILKLSDLDNLVQTTFDTYGKVDVLVGNAGVGNHFDLVEMDLEKDFDRTVNLFCKANWYLAKLLLPHFIQQNKGDFIFTTSTAAYNGVPRGSVYSGAKAMLLSLMRALAMGYGKYNIRANSVVPGLTTTELSPPGGAMEAKQLPYIPMGRPGTALEVAYAILFLASDECRYCTATEIVINGGSDHMGVYYPNAAAATNEAMLTGIAQ